MKISKIKMTKVNNEDSRVKAVVTLTFDNCVTIRDIKIVQASNGFFVRMPAQKNEDGNFLDVCYSINSEFREYVSREVLNLYNSEKTEHVYEGEFTKPKIEILVEPINDSDVIVANVKVTFDNSFCVNGVKILKLKDENNKIIFAFPSRKTIAGKIIHICEIVGYYNEYYSHLFDAFEKEISKKSGANIQVENENLKRHKLIASVFYSQTIGMIIDNINNDKEFNEKESIIKLISESSNKFEEINNEVIVYFYKDAKVVYTFEDNKLQSAIGTLEDGKSYMFERNIVEEKKRKLEKKDESTLKEFSQEIEGYPIFKFYFPANLGEYVKVAPTVFEIKEGKTQKVRVMISKCENSENVFKLSAREWIEKNKKENSMDEISYREEMINNTLIEVYVLKYINRKDLPFKIYKIGYVKGYRITISGWQKDNIEEFIDNAFKNIKIETNEEIVSDKSKNSESENDRYFKYGLNILADLIQKFAKEKNIPQEEIYKYFINFPFDYYKLIENHKDYTVMKFPLYKKDINGKLVLKSVFEAIPEENNRIIKYEDVYDEENKFNFLNNRDIVKLEYEENYNTIICFGKIVQLSKKIRNENESRQKEWLYDNYAIELEKYNKIIVKLKEESKKVL